MPALRVQIPQVKLGVRTISDEMVDKMQKWKDCVEERAPWAPKNVAGLAFENHGNYLQSGHPYAPQVTESGRRLSEATCAKRADPLAIVGHLRNW